MSGLNTDSRLQPTVIPAAAADKNQRNSLRVFILVSFRPAFRLSKERKKRATMPVSSFNYVFYKESPKACYFPLSDFLLLSVCADKNMSQHGFIH